MDVASSYVAKWRSSKGNRLRLPWTNENCIKEHCISCNGCITACPEGILIHGPAKTPVVNFANGECTFCEACVYACPEPVFIPANTSLRNVSAALSIQCLLDAGISCQVCTDFCDVEASRFDLSVRPVGKAMVEADLCTGCRACVSACPERAIEVRYV